MIYRVADGAGVDLVKYVSRDWSPWFQERPKIRARVLTPDGVVLTLDPRVMSEQPVRTDRDTDTDQRSLHAPLPGVQQGAIVEVVTVVRDRLPRPGAGRWGLMDTQMFMPTRHWRRRIVVPAGVPFHWYASGPPGLVGVSVRHGDRVTWTWEQHGVPGAGPLEPGAPREAWARPSLVWSTSPGWGAVARAYAGVVDAALGPDVLAALRPTAERVLAGARTPAEAARRILVWARTHLHDAGRALGQTPRAPQDPAALLAHGRGDGEDLATLVVGLLRAGGFSAHVALVAQEDGPMLRDDVAGIEAFDHALVALHAPLGEKPRSPEAAAARRESVGAKRCAAPEAGPEPAAGILWLDPAYPFYDVGRLPLDDRQRRALVVAPDTQGLVWTVPRAGDDREEAVFRVTLRPQGPARVVEEHRYWGALGNWVRAMGTLAPDALRKEFSGAARGRYSPEGSVRVTMPAPDGPDPAVVRVEVERATFATLDDSTLEFPLRSWGALEDLPDALKEEPKAGSRAERALRANWTHRRHLFGFRLPSTRHLEWRVEVPDGLRVELAAPLGDGFVAGPIRLEREVRGGGVGPGAPLVVRTGLTLGAGWATADELRRAHEAVVAYGERNVDVARVTLVPTVKWRLGQREEALREWARLARAHPGDVYYSSRWVEGLVWAGLRDAAIAVARQTVALQPGDADALHVLAWAASQTPVERTLFGPGMRRDVALDALTRIQPPSAGSLYLLTEAYRRGEDGRVGGPGADMAKAWATRQAWRARVRADAARDAGYGDGRVEASKPAPLSALDLDLMAELGRYEEVEKQAPSVPPSYARDLAWAKAAAMLGHGVVVLGLAKARSGEGKPHPGETEEDFRAAVLDFVMRHGEGPLGGEQAASAASYLVPIVGSFLRGALPAREASFRAPCQAAGAAGLALMLGAARLTPWVAPAYHDLSVFDTYVTGTWLREPTGTALRRQGVSARLEALHSVRLPCTPKEVRPGVWFAQGAVAGGWRMPPVFFTRPKPKGRLWALPPLIGRAAAAQSYAAAKRGAWDEARWWLDRAGAWWGLAPLKTLAPKELRELGKGEGRGRWSEVGLGLPSPSAKLSPDRVRLLGGVAGARYASGDDPWLVEAVLALEPGDGRDEAMTLLVGDAARGHRSKLLRRLVRGLGPTKESARVVVSALLALKVLRRYDEVERWARAWWDGPGAKASPADRVMVARLAGNAREWAGDPSGARAWFQAGVEADPGEGARNSLAWLALFDDSFPGGLEQALTLTEGFKESVAVHTRAALLAALDRPAAALAALLPTVEPTPEGGFEPHDYLVLGRAAQTLGLPDVARAYYERVVPRRDGAVPPSMSSASLAVRWAKTLLPPAKRAGGKRR